jgi:hypothetical protein
MVVRIVALMAEAMAAVAVVATNARNLYFPVASCNRLDSDL